MKTLKFLGSTVLLCLFVVACAKSNKEEQARIAGDGDNKAKIEETEKAASDSRARVAKEGYTSKNVTLLKNTGEEAKSTGTITIFDEDARRLYERLKIVPTGDNEMASDTKTKQGKNLACSEFVRGENKVYSCILAINYATGKLASADKNITVDENAKVNTEAFTTGKNLSILEGKEGNGILSVSGDDAKVLYEVLTVKETSMLADAWLSSKEKMGANLRCYSHSTLKTDAAPSYTCSLSINVNDGTVKSSDVTEAAKPAASEPAAETPAADAPAADAPAADAPTGDTAPETPAPATDGSAIIK